MANYSEIEQLKIDMAAKKYANDTNGDWNRNFIAFQEGAEFVKISRDEFAMGFGNWILNTGIYAANNKKTWILDHRDLKDYTTKELLTIYKDSLNNTSDAPNR